jgi:hypothetical protein
MEGEFVIFHPPLVHFGGGYETLICRLHLYSMTAKIPLAYEKGDINTYSVNNIQSCGQTKQELSNQLKNGKRKKEELKDKRLFIFYCFVNFPLFYLLILSFFFYHS